MKSSEWHVAARELRILIERIAKVSRRDTERRLAASAPGISGLQYGILRILSDQDFAISELSLRMQREPATLVPVVDALEDKGLVRRGQDPKDRRRTPLTITANGTAVLDRVPLVDENDLLVCALKELGDPKVRRLLALLRELATEVSRDKNKPAKINTLTHS
jgi:DNA-binding MarR family transcriptional regulator